MKTELTCIVCPRGCHLVVDEDLKVTGNSCPRGEAYGKQEVTDPRRTVTSTVRVDSTEFAVLPVKTKGDISKGKIFEVMEEINKVHAHVPVHIGDVLVHDIANSGVDLVATRTLLK